VASEGEPPRSFASVFSFSTGKRSGGGSRYGARLGLRVDSPGHIVLIVDDDASIRLLCRLNLELEGWHVLEAPTLSQAREHLAAGGVEVVVLDVHVGSGNGIEFLQELRRERPEVKVAMLTGSGDLGNVGSDAVIPKPFAIEQLTSTVANLAG
jgi:DNA-binding response OmpR family regulator